MEIKPLRSDLLSFIKRHGLVKKFAKQFKIYSFRIDRKYRTIFGFVDSDTIEIVDINLHYR